MINSVEQYLSELKKELSGADRATMQDALSDAEEYLRNAFDGAAKEPGRPLSDVLQPIIEKYGAPAEVAAAYKNMESRTLRAYVPPALEVNEAVAPATALHTAPDTRPFPARFFGIFTESRMWGSLLYFIFALATGIIYFTWAITGISISLSLLVLIVGLPIAGLFLLSVRGAALLEGRLVEALLGVRMPHRPLFSRKDINWWQKFKSMLASRHTWTALVYMILMLPLGIIYFSVFITLFAVSVWFITSPIWLWALNIPFAVDYQYGYFIAPWATILTAIGGVLLLTATMHLVKLAGKGHGHLAKAMLVRE